MINRILEAKNNRQNHPQTNDETSNFIQQPAAGGKTISRFGAQFSQQVIHSIEQLIAQLSKQVLNKPDFNSAIKPKQPKQYEESPLFFLTGLSIKTSNRSDTLIAGDIVTATLVTLSGDTDLEFMLSQRNIDIINSKLYQSKELQSNPSIIENLLEKSLHQVQLSGQDVLNYVNQTTEFNFIEPPS